MADLRRKTDALWRAGATAAERREIEGLDRQLAALDAQRGELRRARQLIANRCAVRARRDLVA